MAFAARLAANRLHPRFHSLNFSGIKSDRIGKERCEAKCQTPRTNQRLISCPNTFLTITNTTGLIAAAFCNAWHGPAPACFGRSAAAFLLRKHLLKSRKPESHGRRLATLPSCKLVIA